MNTKTPTQQRRVASGNDRTQRRSGGRSNSYKKTFGKRSSGRPSFRGFGRAKNSGRSSFNPSQFINRTPSTTEVEEEFSPIHTFEQFGLAPSLLVSLNKMGVKKPTPIQDRIIPEILKGNDVVGLAETGTGKTAAFLLPLIDMTLKDGKRRTLIVTPTRELAVQIEAELKMLGQGMNLQSVVCVGGAGIGPQISALQRNPRFIIGTPGRLIDLINRGKLQPENIKTVILDEADRMLDMGFINDIRAILGKTPASRETHLFSATMASSAQALVKDFLRNPVEISVKKRDTISSISQNVISYSPDKKFEKLTETLEKIKGSRIIIFGAMKYSVEKLAKQLKQFGFSTDSIHGNKSHGQRKRSLDRFKNGQIKILVATDVAARGIHVNNVSHVINYDLPSTFEDYIHRIGRTGRAHKSGEALTFVSERTTEDRRPRPNSFDRRKIR